MQVNVFIADVEQGEQSSLLVLPYEPQVAIPAHLADIRWRHFAITGLDDGLLAASAAQVEDNLASQGYCLIEPAPPAPDPPVTPERRAKIEAIRRDILIQHKLKRELKGDQ